MNIQEISKANREVTVTLDADELIKLCNVMHNAPEKDRNERFYDLRSDLIIARDLCQYGHLDDFSLSCVVDSRTQCGNIEEEIKRRKKFREKHSEKKEQQQ